MMVTRGAVVAVVAAALGTAPGRGLPAQSRDSVSVITVAPGVTVRRILRPAGPWIINVASVDLRRTDYELRQVRARDSLRGRERLTSMVARTPGGADRVLVAVNTDFFNVQTGESENNVVIGGEWWKGVRVADSPFESFPTVRAQFALGPNGHPLLDKFQFDAVALVRGGVIPILGLNSVSRTGPEASAIFTKRIGVTPVDTVRKVAEAPLVPVGERRGDTLVYLRVGAVETSGGHRVGDAGIVLAAYGARAASVARLAAGDTVRIVLRARTAANVYTGLRLLVGGWPRILRGGENIAGRAASDEATLSSNAEARHPRSAIGFSRDSSTLFLVTVDGRQASSVGMTIVELADLMREFGAWDALNFDGGGSTTMVVQGRIVNSPSDAAGEREIASGLLLVGASPAPAQTPRPALPKLDSAQLVRDLFVLAADSMEGRRIGTPGGARARSYLVSRLRQAGVAPVGEGLAVPFTTTGRGGAELAGTNLIGLIRGTREPDRFIVLSAHYDHVGVRNGQIYPGADDNASGASAVLAIAAWLKAHPPEHSVIVALFDGEESGLLGAKAFVATPSVALDRIIANVNLDMVGRNEKGELWAAGGSPNPALRPLIAATAAVATVKLRPGHDSGGGHEDWTDQSDQGAFHAKHIPWIYFGVEDHPDYHKPTDFPGRIEPSFFFRSASTIAEFVRRLDAAPPSRSAR